MKNVNIINLVCVCVELEFFDLCELVDNILYFGPKEVHGNQFQDGPTNIGIIMGNELVRG